MAETPNGNVTKAQMMEFFSEQLTLFREEMSKQFAQLRADMRDNQASFVQRPEYTARHEWLEAEIEKLCAVVEATKKDVQNHEAQLRQFKGALAVISVLMPLLTGAIIVIVQHFVR